MLLNHVVDPLHDGLSPGRGEGVWSVIGAAPLVLLVAPQQLLSQLSHLGQLSMLSAARVLLLSLFTPMLTAAVPVVGAYF